MSSKVLPPKFIDDASGYPEYKKKLLRWSRITKVEVEKQAEVVLHYLEGHPSGIQEKIDTALGEEIEDQVDGMKKLIEYMDSIYAEDEMTTAWTKYKEFVRLKKNVDQPVVEFIAEFDKKHKKAKETGCEFSDIVLGFNLLESCNLSETDEKFVLTAVDFKTGKQNKNLLEQIKNSLRKFQSREKLSSYRDDRIKVKEEEDSFVTDIKGALVADGWTPPSSSSSTSVVKQNSPFYKGKKNKLGADGKPMRCFRCQSEYHMAYECDKKGNMQTKTSTEANLVVGAGNSSKESPKSTALSKVLAKNRGEGTALSKVLAKASATDYGMICQVSEDVVEAVQCNQEDSELVLVSHEESELCLLIEEAGSRAVLDTACSKSAAGLDWVRNYTELVSPTYSDQLELRPSAKIYQFGGGEKRKSEGQLTLPVVIGNKKINLSIEVVNAPIPLLIGSNSMEKAKAVLNFGDNTAVFFDESIHMTKVGVGHFCIDVFSQYVESHINDARTRDEFIEHTFASADKVDINMLKKLHHYYGHTPPDRLLKLLENAGKDTKHLRKPLRKIEKSCEACIRTKNRCPRPKSAIPRVSDPHMIVSLDLKEWTYQGKRLYICYMIDLFSRMTLGGFVKDKTPDSIVECILSVWFRVFGQMKGIHSDIGGEFSNSTLEEVASKLGVELTTTAAYSPHQNGINERNHAIVDMMLTRMLFSDSTMKPEMALMWALNAKNSLENCDGFSPFQLHIGKNPLFPSATRDGPSSYETVTKSKAFASHLNAMHAARKEFINAEASSSLKQALKSRVYPRGHDIAEGDIIYYKQRKSGASKNTVWQGPCKVISTNGKKLFLDKGGRCITVNRDDSVRRGEEMWKYSETMDEENNEVNESISRVLRNTRKENLSPSIRSDNSSESDSDEEDLPQEDLSDHLSQSEQENNDGSSEEDAGESEGEVVQELAVIDANEELVQENEDRPSEDGDEIDNNEEIIVSLQ